MAIPKSFYYDCLVTYIKPNSKLIHVDEVNEIISGKKTKKQNCKRSKGTI